jgi:hypothetical protein
VVAELLAHPRTVDFSLSRMMEHMQLHRTAKELPHRPTHPLGSPLNRRLRGKLIIAIGGLLGPSRSASSHDIENRYREPISGTDIGNRIGHRIRPQHRTGFDPRYRTGDAARTNPGVLPHVVSGLVAALRTPLSASM